MSPVSIHFQNILNIQRQIGHYFPEIVRPPVKIDEIRKAEKSVGFSFNEEIFELYLTADGSDPGITAPMAKSCFYPLEFFIPLNEAVERYVQQFVYGDGLNILFTTEDGYTPGAALFPFLENGSGGMTWVDLNVGSPNYGKIFQTPMGGDPAWYIFSSLTTLLEAIYKAYSDGTFWIDEEGLLDGDVDRWYDILEENRPVS